MWLECDIHTTESLMTLSLTTAALLSSIWLCAYIPSIPWWWMSWMSQDISVDALGVCLLALQGDSLYPCHVVGFPFWYQFLSQCGTVSQTSTSIVDNMCFPKSSSLWYDQTECPPSGWEKALTHWFLWWQDNSELCLGGNMSICISFAILFFLVIYDSCDHTGTFIDF